MAPFDKLQKDMWQIFDRVPFNSPFTAEILHIHGYPSVDDYLPRSKSSANVEKRRKISCLLNEHFFDEHGNKLFIINSDKFFFLTEDDAHLFRSLLLLI